MRIICVVILLLVAMKGAEAAEIEVARLKAGSALVVIEGPLDLGDIETFRAKVEPLSKATVALLSDGGSLLAGIRIGTMIRAKNFATVVPDGARCASACAFAWLGGARRFVGKESNVGFHAAYIMKAGGPAESGPGNAILGAYLSQLGLSEQAILFITQEGPSSIHWMSMEEAEEHGIAVALLPPSPPAPPSRENAPPSHANLTVVESPTESPERRAIDFVRRLMTRWSGPNVDVLLSLGELYADNVRYYGKSISRETVLLRKRRFVERWPQRSYRIRPGSLSATCADAAGTCRVKGMMDFEFRNAGTSGSARGVKRFEYRVVLASGAPQIEAEAETSAGKGRRRTPVNPLKQAGRNIQQLFGQLSKLAAGTARPKAAIRH